MTWRAYHRTSAVLLLLFVGAHIGNHIAAAGGQYEHQLVMATLRRVYRHPLVEPLLLLLFLAQAGTGATLVIKGWRGRRGRVAWLQALSGLYLAGFLFLHVVSVLTGRLVLGLDTDFRFAAAGFHVPGWPWFFAPYYFLAVVALFAHLGCALYWAAGGAARGRARVALAGMIALGGAAGGLIVAALAGGLYAVHIPAAYLASYR